MQKNESFRDCHNIQAQFASVEAIDAMECNGNRDAPCADQS